MACISYTGNCIVCCRFASLCQCFYCVIYIWVSMCDLFVTGMAGWFYTTYTCVKCVIMSPHMRPIVTPTWHYTMCDSCGGWHKIWYDSEVITYCFKWARIVTIRDQGVDICIPMCSLECDICATIRINIKVPPDYRLTFAGGGPTTPESKTKEISQGVTHHPMLLHLWPRRQSLDHKRNIMLNTPNNSFVRKQGLVK